jgi:hypothetical protein
MQVTYIAAFYIDEIGDSKEGRKEKRSVGKQAGRGRTYRDV